MIEQVTAIGDWNAEGSDFFVAKAWRCVILAAMISLKVGESAYDVEMGIWHAWNHDCDFSRDVRCVCAFSRASLQLKCWLGRGVSQAVISQDSEHVWCF